MAKNVALEPANGTSESKDGLRVYELGYLLSPKVQDEALGTLESSLTKIITDRGGEIIAEGKPDPIDPAYTIEKTIDNKKERFEQAYFGWVKFALMPEKLAEIKELVEKMKEMLRHLLITTVRENTMLSKKPLSKILRREKRGKKEDALDSQIPAVDLESGEKGESTEDIALQASQASGEDAAPVAQADEEKLDEEIEKLVEGKEEK